MTDRQLNIDYWTPEFSTTDDGLVYDDDGDPVELSFTADFGTPDPQALREGFNEFGVRENRTDDDDLESIDVIFEAMEPGPPKDRKGVRITKDFLRKVADKNYDDKPPALMDHRKETLSKIGHVEKVWFSEKTGKLMVMDRIFNTGAQSHDEIIKRFTHDPPTITNGSVGFGRDYTVEQNQNDEPELVDGRVREFSTTPFPGGYDNGGLRAAYSDAVDDGGTAETSENPVSDVDFSTDTISL